MHIIWKLSVLNLVFAIFVVKVIINYSFHKKFNKFLNGLKIVTNYFVLKTAIDIVQHILVLLNAVQSILNSFKRLDTQIKSIQIFTLLVDIMTLVKYNHWIFEWNIRLEAQILVNYIVIWYNCHITILNLCFHEIIRAQIVDLSNFDIILNR